MYIIRKLKVAHDTGSVHNTMTTAEQKRWSTMTNALATFTFLKKFYEKTHLNLITIGDKIDLDIFICNEAYSPQDIMQDLEDIAEENAKAFYEQIHGSAIQKINIKWELEPYDN